MWLASKLEDWWFLVERSRRVAELTVEDRIACGEAWYQPGRAVECALKARIVDREGLDAWPDRGDRPDLHTHDLRRLLAIAGLGLAGLDRDADGDREVALGSLLARPSWTYRARPARVADEAAWEVFRRRAEAAAEEVVPSA